MTKGFKIIGIATRTTNQGGQSLQDLGKLWTQFYTDDIFGKIPNKISNEIYAVYTDYQGDFTEAYTAIIGVPVSTLDETPEGLLGREFMAEHFKKFTAKGEMPNAIMSTWADIWQREEELNRKYSYDFEVYCDKPQNGAESEVEIFLSVK